MSDIDRDALIDQAARALLMSRDVGCGTSSWRNRTMPGAQAQIAVDAILPAVTEAIQAAEARGREQAAKAIEADYGEVDSRVPTSADTPSARTWVGGAKAGMRFAARLARGATDEEQA